MPYPRATLPLIFFLSIFTVLTVDGPGGVGDWRPGEDCLRCLFDPVGWEGCEIYISPTSPPLLLTTAFLPWSFNLPAPSPHPRHFPPSYLIGSKVCFPPCICLYIAQVTTGSSCSLPLRLAGLRLGSFQNVVSRPHTSLSAFSCVSLSNLAVFSPTGMIVFDCCPAATCSGVPPGTEGNTESACLTATRWLGTCGKGATQTCGQCRGSRTSLGPYFRKTWNLAVERRRWSTWRSPVFRILTLNTYRQ